MAIQYLLATIALLVGTAAIYIALLKIFPVQWLYYHYFIRKPIIWSLLGVGLPSDKRDDSFPARTHVIGLLDPTAASPVVYLKTELNRHGIVKNDEMNAILVAVGDTIVAFKGVVAG